MLLAEVPNRDITPALIEGCLTALLAVTAFICPRLGSAQFSRIERSFARFARRKGLAVAAVGISTLLLRLAILPICPVPLPFVPDDFSFLLASDTFAHGRLTNPTPAMWMHFESLHITMQPSYMSMYFPAQGLVMAAGQVVFGNPWWCLLIVSALMCAAICWMLQAWLPPSWALLGGILAVLRLGVFSYWINTYTGAGLISALGGALVLGAFPRLIKTAKARYGILLALGIVPLALNRPYESMLLCLPVAVVLGRWALFGKNRPAPWILVKRAALPLALLVAAAAWLGYYDYRAFGNPTTLPYTVDRATYAMAPYFVWQPLRPKPVYRHDVLRTFYSDLSQGELIFYTRLHAPYGFIPETLRKAWSGMLFYSGAALLLPLFMLRRVLMDRRTRFLVVCVLVLMAGMVIEIYLIPHYLAPFTAAFYALGLQAMRHLRVWNFEGKPVGAMLVRLMVTLCLLAPALRLGAQPLHLTLGEWPPSNWSLVWYGPDHFGTERAGIVSKLEQLPGKQLVIVRYSSHHNPLDEWVYNLADIDGSKVVWAREMNAADNLELIHYYHDRQVWLVEPDALTPMFAPYPVPGQPAVASH